MPAARRTAALLALVLTTAGCTEEQRGDPSPAPDRSDVIDTVDLDAAVGTDVVIYDLAASPAGVPVALLGADDAPQSWLLQLALDDAGATTDVRAIPAVDSTAQLAVAPDGTVLVADDELTHVPPGTAEVTAVPWDLGAAPTAVALSPDGRTLYAARDTTITAVDVATGAVTGTGAAPGPVTHLAATPDGGLAALVTADRPAGGPGALLVLLDREVRPVGEPVELVPERGSTATALQVTADGTAVVALHLGEARAVGQLVTVAGGELRTVVDFDGAGDTALDLAISPDGRLASVPLADLSFTAELVTVDLVGGERIGTVTLCAGTGVFGAIAPLGDSGDLVVTGACLDDDGPQSTAFVVG
ncbi:WD40 repeat domain-containing protein [Geodermatophilus sp. SYSU D00742]